MYTCAELFCFNKCQQQICVKAISVKEGLYPPSAPLRAPLVTGDGKIISYRNDPHAVAYAESFHGGLIQWHMVVIRIWFALFVTSQFNVIFMFPNQRFGEVC